LTQDEQDFLRDLFAESGIGGELITESRALNIDASGADPDLLRQLLVADSLHLFARKGPFLLKFSLYIDESGSESGRPLALRFGYPTILESQGTERCVRVRPAGDEIVVIDPSGILRRPIVEDISSSGLALSDESSEIDLAGTARPIDLVLLLPDGNPVSVRGQVVRVKQESPGQGRHLVAVQFEDTDEETLVALKRYVFRRHRALVAAARPQSG